MQPTSDVSAPAATHADFPLGIRELEVVRREQLTPKMVRIVFRGAEADNFESHTPDEHVKLVFPDPDTGVTRHPVPDGDHLDWPKPFPPTREYTIRRYDAESGEVWMDFVVHPGGLASDWARSVEPGDTLWVAGPRGSMVIPEAFTHRIVLADHTGLPAVARMLEELPAGVRASVAVVVPNAAEEQPLAVRDGVEVTWLHLDDADPKRQDFVEFLDTVAVDAGEHTFLWAGAEAGLLKPVRRWAKARGFAKGSTDVSGYWKTGRKNEVTEGRIRVNAIKHRVAHLLRLDDD